MLPGPNSGEVPDHVHDGARSGIEVQGCEVQGCKVQGCKVQGCKVQGCKVQGCEIELELLVVVLIRPTGVPARSRIHHALASLEGEHANSIADVTATVRIDSVGLTSRENAPSW